MPKMSTMDKLKKEETYYMITASTEKKQATQAMLTNAQDAINQINAQLTHIAQQIAAKEQQITDLAAPVAQAQTQHEEAQNEGEQIAQRLKYTKQQSILAQGTPRETEIKQSITTIQAEQKAHEKKQKDAKALLDKAQAAYDEQEKVLQQDLAKLHDEVSTTRAQLEDMQRMARELLEHLGHETMEALRTQIENYEQQRTELQNSLAEVKNREDEAREAIDRELATWPALSMELHRSHGVKQKDDATSNIMKAWLQFVEVLRANGPHAVTFLDNRQRLLDLLDLPQGVQAHLMSSNAWQERYSASGVSYFNQQVDVVQMTLRDYCLQHGISTDGAA